MSGNPLWLFSLDVYGRPGVAPACLALQDEAGADVNLVLFLLWCAATGRPLDAAAVAAADTGLERWREAVVEPLRAVRRAMKADLLPAVDTEGCRQRIKAVELDAERLSQEALLAIAPARGLGDASAAAAAHLALYASHLGRPLPQDALRTLLAALPRED